MEPDMNSAARTTSTQLRLGQLHEQLVTDDTNLRKAVIPWLRDLIFNTFSYSQWQLANSFPHVQIGTRNTQPVYVFPTLDAIATIPHRAVPSLQVLRISQETLRDVDIFAPLNGVHEWKKETSGRLSPGFKALIQYLLLLYIAETGSDSEAEIPGDVTCLRKALLQCIRAGNTNRTKRSRPHGPDTSVQPNPSESTHTAREVTSNTVEDLEDMTARDTATSRTATESAYLPMEIVQRQPDNPVVGQSTEESIYRNKKRDINPKPGHGHARLSATTRISKARAPVKGFFSNGQMDSARPAQRTVKTVAENRSDLADHFLASNRKRLSAGTKQKDSRDDQNLHKSHQKAVKLRQSNRSHEFEDNVAMIFDDDTDNEPFDAVQITRPESRITGMFSSHENAAEATSQTVQPAAASLGRGPVAEEDSENADYRWAPVLTQNAFQSAQLAGIETAAALYSHFGIKAQGFIHKDTPFSLYLRPNWHPVIVPLGVCIGTLFHDAGVAIIFHLIPTTDPDTRAAMTWYAFDMRKCSEVTWKPSNLLFQTLIAEIDLLPTFHAWSSEDDFLALLCLIVISASEEFLGSPYSHRIPIAQYCRGQLAEMWRKVMVAEAATCAERERDGELGGAVALFGPGTSSTLELESIAALKRATGVDPRTILLGSHVDTMQCPSVHPEFLTVGVHIGALAAGLQPVFALIAPQCGTPSVAPMMLITYDAPKQTCRVLAGSEAVISTLAHIRPTTVFSKAHTVADILALVSLVILHVVEQRKFGPVNHMIPIVPWCRGHLATMMRRVVMKGDQAER